MTLAPGTRLGPYRIQGELRSGGTGEVYRARDTRLDRAVAIMVLRRELTEAAGLRQRLETESRAISAISHPNICALIDVGQHEGSHFLVMEHAEGDTLADLLRRRVLNIQQGLTLSLQIAETLQAAHKRGVLHRDLSTSNILVTPEGKVKLFDFGLRNPLVAGAGRGAVTGNPAYMSPEEIRGREAGKQADLWSLGCVLYEILSGRRAFGGGGVQDALTAVLERDPDWSALSRSTPEAIRELLIHCLDRDPSRRLGDAGKAARVIGEALAELKETSSRKASRAVRLGMWVAVAILILIVIAVATMIGCRRFIHPRVSKLEPLNSTNVIVSFAARPEEGGGSW